MPGCLICMENFGGKPIAESEPISPAHINASDGILKTVTTKCGHLFHSKCIDSWIRHKGPRSTCPMCNKKVTKATLVPIFIDWGEFYQPEDPSALFKARIELAEATRKYNQILKEKTQMANEHLESISSCNQSVEKLATELARISRICAHQRELLAKSEESIKRLKRNRRSLARADDFISHVIPVDLVEEPVTKSRKTEVYEDYGSTSSSSIYARVHETPGIISSSNQSYPSEPALDSSRNSHILDLSLSDVETPALIGLSPVSVGFSPELADLSPVLIDLTDS